MDDERLYQRWNELGPLVEKAEGIEPDQLDAFCKSECGDDEELLSLLQEMLHEEGTDSDQRLHDSISQLAGQATSRESLVGTSVGAYKLIEELGVGGMGAVYLATRADGEFEKKVAVKVVRRRLQSSELTAMFRNERQALADLFHPSIPTLVDSGELEDGRPYFICDFIDGIAVDDYCREKELGVTKILHLFESVAGAVQHAHTNFILHLDIKPKNVLVQKDGTPSLLDFGVARAFDDDSEENRAFSPSYASPEQIRGERLTAASDVYSLGALLYCMLSGEKPFEVSHKAPTQTVFAERAKFIEHLQTDFKLDNINADLRAIIQKAMADRPSNRYATVESLLNDTNRFKLKLPVKARGGGTGYRLGKLIQRQRLALALTGVALVTLSSFIWREVNLRQQAEASEAAALQASIEATREAETAREVSDFWVDIFEVSDDGPERGKSITAKELLDSATQRVNEAVAEQPYAAANLKHTMGSAYVGLGLYDEALPMLEEARRISETNGNTSSLIYAEILHSLGKHYDAIARHPEAIEALTISLDLKKKLFGSRDPSVVDDLVGLGRLYRIISDSEKSEAMLQEARQIVEDSVGVDHLLNGTVLHELSKLYDEIGKAEQSMDFIKQSVEILRKHESDPLKLGGAIVTLGTRYRQFREFDKAHETYQDALEVVEGVISPEHPTIGSYYFLIGINYMEQENYEPALEATLKALTIQKAGLPETHPSVAFTYSVLGELYQRLGQLEEAEGPMLRALEIVRVTHPEEHVNVSFEKLMLAGLYLDMGKLDDAQRVIDDCVKNYALAHVGARSNYYESLWKQADILNARGREDEAAQAYVEVFETLESLDTLDEYYVEEFAKKYAEFLSGIGEPVEVEILEGRLRD